MDPFLTPLLAFIIQNGVSGFLLVALVFLTKHHLQTLKDHQTSVDILKKEQKENQDKALEENRELEKELRVKIEELLKDQLETQKPLTEALVEYNRLVRRFRRGEGENERP